MTPGLTLIGPIVAVGSAPLLASAWNTTIHDPAGNVVLPVQVPSTGMPEVNHSPTTLPATVAVTPFAGLPAAEL